jgi:IS30 family transposase
VQCKQPSPSRPTQVPETHDFNDVVGVDLLEIQDMDSVRYDVMSIVDLGSRYHVAVLLEDKSSQTVARNFARYWVQWAGAPKKVMHDQGCEFKGRFERLMERLNIETYVTPTDSAWQNGVVERHGGILKAMHRHIVQQTSASGEEDMEMTLLEACLAKNQLSRRHGFSPIQHVLGQDIRLPASILNGSGEMSAHSLAAAEGSFQRRLALRQAARMAWI